MLNLLLENPTSGDWASKCIDDLKELNIDMSFAEIKSITKKKFKNILKEEMKKNALKYLNKNVRRRGKKLNIHAWKCQNIYKPLTHILQLNKNVKCLP